MVEPQQDDLEAAALVQVKEQVIQFIQELPYFPTRYVAKPQPRERFLQTLEHHVDDDPKTVHVNKRYNNIVENMALALQMVDRQLISVEQLREKLLDSQQEAEYLSASKERMTAREHTIRFVQELIDNHSHGLMVQRLSYEIGRLDRGDINDETLAQLLSRARIEYIGTLDNI